MKIMNTIFAIIFATLAAMCLGAILFCGASHLLPIMGASTIMSIMLYQDVKEQQTNNKEQ